MAIPWRAAEAMHWQLGEQDMARRAGVTPFSLTAVNLDNTMQGPPRGSPRGHSHSQSHGSIPRDIIGGPRGYGRVPASIPPSRALATRKDTIQVAPHLPVHMEHGDGVAYGHPGGPLAPIQAQSQQRQGMLPGLAELTTGVSPYNTPAYSVAVPSASPAQSTTASPGPFQPAMGYPPLEPVSSKRRRSLEFGLPETSRRRHLDPRTDHVDKSIPRHMP